MRDATALLRRGAYLLRFAMAGALTFVRRDVTVVTGAQRVARRPESGTSERPHQRLTAVSAEPTGMISMTTTSRGAIVHDVATSWASRS